MSEQAGKSVKRVSSQLRADLLAAAVAVVVAAVFWTQRDYRERLSGLFPDFVLIGLVVLAALLVVRVLVTALRGKADIAGQEGEEEAGESESGGSLAMVFASMAFLAAWVVLLTPLGFNLSGMLAFLAITIFLRRDNFTLKHLLMDIPIAVAVVWLCFLVFTRVLLVPLPVPPFIYG